MKFDTMGSSFKNIENARENTDYLKIEGGVSNLPSIIAEEVTPQASNRLLSKEEAKY